jgi:hypothetical protein
MLEYAAEPGKKVWDAIEAQLNDQSAYVKKLHDFEAAPPANLWEKVNAQLPSEKLQPVIHMKWVRYAAAAVLFIAFSYGYYFLNQNAPTQGAVATGSVLPVLPKQNEKETESRPVAEETKEPQVVQNTITSSPSDNQLNVKDLPKRVAAYSLRKIASDEDHIEVSNSFIPAYAERKSKIAFDASVDKYMVYSDGNGNAMRVPRQLFDYIACITDEINCKRRKAVLRAKLAATTLSADFTGVLDMLSGLKENQ